MIDLSEVSYREILDCIVDASLGRLSPYFQEYARHEITSLANADGELPQAAVILQWEYHIGSTIKHCNAAVSATGFHRCHGDASSIKDRLS